MNCKCTNVYATTIITISLLFLVIINLDNSNFGIVYAQSSTTSSTVPDFNFGSAGDWGCNSNTDATVNSIQNQIPEIVLGLGDYSYQSTANCWLTAVNPIDEKMKITIGNHENSASGEDLNTYLNHFGMTSQYYSFNYENVHFLSMATELSYSSGSAQNLFVKNDLASAAADPNIDWIIVFFHKPMYSSPNSCSSCGGETALRDLYHPLFDQYDVDLVLEGHTHNYQRSYPIKYNPSNPSNPIVTDTNKINYNDPQGQIYSIVGTGGVNFHSLSGQSSFTASQQAIRFGHLNIDIINNGTTLVGKFIPNEAGITPDEFTITKQRSTTNPPPNPQPTGYHYEPFLTINTSNDIVTIPNVPELKLAQTFTVAAWLKTTTNFRDDAIAVNKGGLSTDSTGNNMNYGLWMTSSEKLRGGFETSSGTNKFVTSSASYNTGKWQHGVVTFDGSTIKLYINGTIVSRTSTSTTPESSGSHPLRIGADSRIIADLFTGSIDEVGVWNRALDENEISKLMNNNTFPSEGKVYSNSFGSGSQTSLPSPSPSSPSLSTSTLYHYTPFLSVNDASDLIDVKDSSSLRLSKFSLGTWFKTTTIPSDEGIMVNKGGLGSDLSGKNMNYGIWLTPSGALRGGFELMGGDNRYVTSSNSPIDGKWHHGLVTFDGSSLKLFLDGKQISTLSTTKTPDMTGNQPLRIGANSLTIDDFFKGDIDEVGVWSRALTTTEISDLINKGIFVTKDLIYRNSFS
jgi:hypothetical protein